MKTSQKTSQKKQEWLQRNEARRQKREKQSIGAALRWLRAAGVEVVPPDKKARPGGCVLEHAEMRDKALVVKLRISLANDSPWSDS